jgi:hypothetical protein
VKRTKCEPLSISEVTPEDVAEMFHDAYENFAPLFGYKTRDATAVPWDQVPEDNRALMIATIRNVLIERLNIWRTVESLQAEVERLRAVIETIACSEAPALPHPDDPRIRLYADIVRKSLGECGDLARAALPDDHVLNRIRSNR